MKAALGTIVGIPVIIASIKFSVYELHMDHAYK